MFETETNCRWYWYVKKYVYYIVCSLVRVGRNQPQPCPQYRSLQYRSPRWNRDILQSRSRKGQSQGHPIRWLNMFRDYFLALSFFFCKTIKFTIQKKKWNVSKLSIMLSCIVYTSITTGIHHYYLHCQSVWPLDQELTGSEFKSFWLYMNYSDLAAYTYVLFW